MKQAIKTIILAGLVTMGQAVPAQAKLLRAREMNSEQWAEILKNGAEEIAVEFREGENFKPLNQVIKGSFTAGAGSGHAGLPVNAVELSLKALLK